MTNEERDTILNEEYDYGTATKVYFDLKSLQDIGYFVHGVPEWAKKLGEAFEVPTGSSVVLSTAMEKCADAFYRTLTDIAKNPEKYRLIERDFEFRHGALEMRTERDIGSIKNGMRTERGIGSIKTEYELKK